jgi:hypothetical protein
MPLKETIEQRKLLRSQQVVNNEPDWLCIRCNNNFPKEDFLTAQHGYRLKCKICSEKENKATAEYRAKHLDKIKENIRHYEDARKLKRDETIKKHTEMVESGCDMLICTKCKKEKPKESFKNHNRSFTKHCYECRQYQSIIEAKREPTARIRRPRTVKKTPESYACQKYCSYRRSDIDKGFFKTNDEFEKCLSKDFAYELMRNKCVYCGFHKPGEIGLDRVDPCKPHTVDNVLSCCEICNVSKNNLSLQTFHIYSSNLFKAQKYWLSPTRLWECPF